MAQFNYSESAVVAGQVYSNTETMIVDGVLEKEVILDAAKDGTLTTRTSDTAGTLTMATGHGITTGQRLDIYWDGGACFGATVGTVSGDSVPFTLAEGTVLPIATTVITAMVPQQEDFIVTGNNVEVLAVFGGAVAQVVLTTSFPVTLHNVYIDTAGQSKIWFDGNGITNPLAGDAVTRAYLSHGSSAGAATVRVVALFD